MSNEYKEWVNDKVTETLFDANAIDQIEEICIAPYIARRYVHGWKNGQKVAFMVWLNDEGEWVFEHREIEK